jgi:hypothetical protein
MPLRVIKEFPGAVLGEFHFDGARLLLSIFQEPLVQADGLIHDYGLHFVGNSFSAAPARGRGFA